MFKSVELNENGFHAKLYKFVYRREPEFNNFCPYFWLTMLAIPLSVFVAIFLGTKWLLTVGLKGFAIGVATIFGAPLGLLVLGLTKAIEGFFWIMDRLVCLPAERVSIANLTDEQVVKLYNGSRDRLAKEQGWDLDYALRRLLGNADSKSDQKKKARVDAKFQVWKELEGEKWEETLSQIIERWKKEDEERQKREDERLVQFYKEEAEAKERAKARAKKRKELLAKLVTVSKVVVPILLLALAGLVLHGLVKLVLWIPWLALGTGTWSVLKWIISLPVWFVRVGFQATAFLWNVFDNHDRALMLAMVLGGLVLIKWSRKCDIDLRGWFRYLNQPMPDWIGEFFHRLVKNVITPVLNALGEGVVFLVDGFMMWKKDHCPQIVWKK